ncbi:hypothetical protein [Herpetosiphon sp.]|uniref:hypothetical protein n=1 Tax=Herpetosiphon sp. TaxID=71864 RepID=UPI0033902C1F
MTATDIDQNGLYDIVIGAPGEAPGGDPKSGYAFGYQGSSHGPIPWFGIDQHGLDINE